MEYEWKECEAWIGLLEVRSKDGTSSLGEGAAGAFCTAVAYANSEWTFEETVRLGLEELDLELVEASEIERYADRFQAFEVSEECQQLAASVCEDQPALFCLLKDSTMSNSVEEYDRHETAAIEAFVVSGKQERMLALLKKPKNRRKLTDMFAHFSEFDVRCIVEIPSRHQHVSDIVHLLSDMGAPETCYVMSEKSSLDRKQMELREAILAVVGLNMGSLVSCIAGQLAYYEGEGQGVRCILQR